MKKIVLDTSLIIDHVRGKDKRLIKLLGLQKTKRVQLFVSSVVIFEFYSGLSLKKEAIFSNTENLFATFKIVDIDREIAKLAAKINREQKLYQQIGAIDLLIGATAIYYSALLATRNIKDFQLIKGLKFWTDS